MPSTRALFWSITHPDHLRRLVPVELHAGRLGIGAHDRRHLARDAPDGRNVFAGDAELHRKADRRAVLQSRDPAPQRRVVAIEKGQRFRTHLFALGDALREHDDLREVGLLQLLVERQIEARAAAAHVGDVALDTRHAVERAFELLRLLERGGEGAAFRQPEIDQQFRPRRGREELLRDEAEQRQRPDEDRQRGNDHRLAMVDAPDDQRAQPQVERRAIDGLRVGVVR